jgi:hypothetical protein
MDSARKVGFVTGTIDFRFDFHDDVVHAKPRWTLETPAEVTRWYDMHSRYFAGRFSRPKDLISVNDALVVAPQVANLWERYRAKLHEGVVRFSVSVVSKPRVQLAAQPTPAMEALTVDQALAAIMALRESQGRSTGALAQRPRRISTHLGLSAGTEAKREK